MKNAPAPAFRRRPRSLSAELTAHLEQLIASGHFPPGQALPAERKLAESLGVSRTSLREALQELENKRLIERHHGRQSIVTGFHKDAGSVHEDLSELPASADHAIEIENLIEPHLARLGAQNATRADILQLETVLTASHEYLPPEQSLQMDIEFHLVLARMCSNPLVLGVSKMVADRTQEGRIRAHDTQDSRRLCIAGHREVYEAVAARDLDGAEQAMRRHLNDVHRFMREGG
ncbi:FadR/GntR family transcriptional regulator [Salipiger abyssi]|uniref:FadR/GntR family transcriptional regulator n=1 Tax=Salipiger abyssi TaxID=1250539 RepID=UPI001A8F133E|nr:FadR/GntR family transcriptional regulator [Salipiger abyssi]MBN9888188.1 FadR family transcriptional regulator [Salipiger abyssi]